MKILLKGLAIFCLLVPSHIQADQVLLDHVIVVVNDLEKAVRAYQNLNFTIKPGRLHKNGSSYINRVWLEATPKVKKLFVSFGAISCGEISNRNARGGDVYKVSNRELILVSPKLDSARSRILGVSFHSDQLISKTDVHGIWVESHRDTLCAALALNKTNSADVKNRAAD